MTERFHELTQRVRDWVRRTGEAGWLGPDDRARIEALEDALPEDLFEPGEARPLVVAFVGGTGVGKSSLLNRVAGRNLARVGVQRPTSREATLYLHESCPLAHLPERLASAPVQVVRHTQPHARRIAWLDTPDLDSTTAEHRQLVLRWLPHVDLVVYVVSPQRYRDDVGWRILLERRGDHGWVFVLNRWDEGAAEQRDDLTRLLREAGFAEPLVLCTSCAPDRRPLPSADQFDQLTGLIKRLARKHVVAELARHKQRHRLIEYRNAVCALLDRLPDPQRSDQLQTLFDELWTRTAAEVRTGLSWPIHLIATRIAAESAPPGWLLRWRRELTAAVSPAPLGDNLTGSRDQPGRDSQTRSARQLDARAAGVWDDWARERIAELLERFEVRAARLGLRPVPLRRALQAAAEQAHPAVAAHLRDGLRMALARPVSLWRRVARRITGFAMVVLPGLATLWVASQVIVGYWRATSGQAGFLGAPFTLHSLLLVLLSWLIPWWLDRRLRPDLAQAARRGLPRGLNAGLDTLRERLAGALDAALAQAGQLRHEGQQLIAELSRATHKPHPLREGLMARVTAQSPT